MTAQITIDAKLAQVGLKGYYFGAIDGNFGPKSQAAYASWQKRASVTWTCSIEGDIILKGDASFFGGNNDLMDDGTTSSGINTKNNPMLMGCALPMAFSNGKMVPSCLGTPLPNLPFLTTRVKITSDFGSIEVPLIDEGPAMWTNHPIDLTIATYKALGGIPAKGILSVTVRILGAAKYLAL